MNVLVVGCDTWLMNVAVAVVDDDDVVVVAGDDDDDDVHHSYVSCGDALLNSWLDWDPKHDVGAR